MAAYAMGNHTVQCKQELLRYVTALKLSTPLGWLTLPAETAPATARAYCTYPRNAVRTDLPHRLPSFQKDSSFIDHVCSRTVVRTGKQLHLDMKA
jgi:hypothetical protein